MNAQALHGHLDALLLAVLERGALHGYAIIEALRARSGGVLDLPTGTIYPALRRLERAGYVSSAWSTVNGRERRTYELTGAGQRALAGERTSWQEFSSTVGQFLGGAPTPGAPA
ncbi:MULTISPECIES: PadR family transcriptional regulator [Plantactinospora]|uniref:Helix-turn-helix transcriptional regulator n=1 Tax=Plantactinospora veratri TaxID=1436122 RepID=A0ABU7SH49_9ACTN|nr:MULTISPECIES: helix-turn-helix transcriptional regulator [unclassified Plantactinospora]AVT30188.1 PadR family transcriptional regulator [Plantactinospora sp. BC1]AVT36704.1 PadR family transcriptional regulator [Plantactinospora sp. BB1]